MGKAEAADVLREFRREHSFSEIREVFETGGGLAGTGELGDVQAAIMELGHLRAADILGVDVPESGVPGEQVTLTGEPQREEPSRSRASPPPRGQEATLSGFADANGNNNNDDNGGGSGNR